VGGSVGIVRDVGVDVDIDVVADVGVVVFIEVVGDFVLADV
jgi:hypothetical protein